jgi:TRAP-type C4-dicarboxylate transport system permease small subunit
VERFFHRLERVLEPVLAGLLAFITIGVFIQVVLRYVFAKSFLWGEELSLFAFIWCCFLGSAICSWRHTHFSFDMLEGLLGSRAEGVQRLVVDLCILTVTVVMVVTGWQFSQMSVARLSPALGITLVVPTIIIPVSGALMSLVCLVDIWRDFRQIATGERQAGRGPVADNIA